jgi:hypothetical protein
MSRVREAVDGSDVRGKPKFCISRRRTSGTAGLIQIASDLGSAVEVENGGWGSAVGIVAVGVVTEGAQSVNKIPIKRASNIFFTGMDYKPWRKVSL